MQVLNISDILGANSCFAETLTRMSAHPAMDRVMKEHQARTLLRWLGGLYSTLVSDEVIEKIVAVASTFARERGSE